MRAHRAEFPLRAMWRVPGLSPAGYHDWLKRPPSARTPGRGARGEDRGDLDGRRRDVRPSADPRGAPGRGRALLDLPAFGLQPPPEPGGQIVRVEIQCRTVLLSAATGPPSPGPERRRSPSLGAALQGPPRGARPRPRADSARFRARRAGAGSRGSGRGVRIRAGGPPAAASPLCSSVARLPHAGTRRIVRASPAVLVVEGVPERAERLLPARSGDVHADRLRPESRQEIG